MHPMGGGTGSDDVTATAANVLSGKTAVTSDSDDEAIEGTMPNNGAMNVTLTPGGNGTTSKNVEAGYYSGGTITADGQAAYSAGHSQGVTDADNRVNTASASYSSGYTNGYNSGHSNFSRGGVCSAVWWRDLTFTIGNGSNNSGFTANDSATLPAGTYAYACGVRTTNWAGSASISVNGSVIANKNTDAGDKYEYSGGGFYTLNSPATVSTSASVYNGCAFAMFVRIS